MANASRAVIRLAASAPAGPATAGERGRGHSPRLRSGWESTVVSPWVPALSFRFPGVERP